MVTLLQHVWKFWISFSPVILSYVSIFCRNYYFRCYELILRWNWIKCTDFNVMNALKRIFSPENHLQFRDLLILIKCTFLKCEQMNREICSVTHLHIFWFHKEKEETVLWFNILPHKRKWVLLLHIFMAYNSLHIFTGNPRTSAYDAGLNSYRHRRETPYFSCAFQHFRQNF